MAFPASSRETGAGPGFQSGLSNTVLCLYPHPGPNSHKMSWWGAGWGHPKALGVLCTMEMRTGAHTVGREMEKDNHAEAGKIIPGKPFSSAEAIVVLSNPISWNEKKALKSWNWGVLNEEPPDISFNQLGLARGFNEGTIRNFPALILDPALKWGEIYASTEIQVSERSKFLCWNLEQPQEFCSPSAKASSPGDSCVPLSPLPSHPRAQSSVGCHRPHGNSMQPQSQHQRVNEGLIKSWHRKGN